VGTKSEFISALREMADFFESHPGVPAPTGLATLYYWSETKEELADIARALGNAKKYYSNDYFGLHREFGPFEVMWIIRRGLVCRRVVVGTRTLPAVPEHIVEDVRWECDDPLLAPEGAS
jgi:hypothetical protein